MEICIVAPQSAARKPAHLVAAPSGFERASKQTPGTGAWEAILGEPNPATIQAPVR